MGCRLSVSEAGRDQEIAPTEERKNEISPPLNTILLHLMLCP